MSLLLVILQFLLIALVAFPFSAPVLTVLDVSLFAAGMVTFFLAIHAMKQRTFTVMPEPKQQGELVTRGIYRVVRHPMYLAVLLCAIGASLAYSEMEKWMLSALLMLVLITKMRREEKLLLKHYPGYAAYRAKVKAIIPFVL
ncbi:MAG TPA: isoprenylcysteine carboxylmethyltransferase family protein [Burkholderiaceae bacterium]|jgi:protein-S-isoprenylcysteine O-methyltransferase Ste14